MTGNVWPGSIQRRKLASTSPSRIRSCGNMVRLAMVCCPKVGQFEKGEYDPGLALIRTLKDGPTGQRNAVNARELDKLSSCGRGECREHRCSRAARLKDETPSRFRLSVYRP